MTNIDAGIAATAGYVSDTGQSGDGVVTVATYDSFVDTEESAGPWLKGAFEEQRNDDVTVEFRVPENGINQFIRRVNEGADVEADLYVGLNSTN